MAWLHTHGITVFHADDFRRPWVRKEKDRFKLLLESHGVFVHEHEYFGADEPTLLMHFQAIQAMQR